MSALKRAGIFVFTFLLLSVVGFVVAGALAGAVAGMQTNNAQAGFQLGKAAGAAFAQRYGIFIYLAALVAAGWIAFRGRGLLVTSGLAVLIYLVAPQGLATDRREARQAGKAGKAGKARPIAPVPKTLVGRRMVTMVPVTLDLPYGTAEISEGTTVEVLAEEGILVRIRVPGGYTTRVPRARLK